MALTDVEVRTAKAVAKPMKLFDGGGLHLRIDPKGSKLWRLAYWPAAGSMDTTLS